MDFPWFKTALLLVFAIIVSSGPTIDLSQASASGDAQLTALAERIAKQRAKLSEIEDSLRTERELARQQTASLSAQIHDLRSQVTRAQARAETLGEMVEERRQTLAKERTDHDALRPALESSFRAIEQVISQSIPFRRQERLERLQSLRRELALGVASPASIAADLWRLVEDELEMGLSSGMRKHVLTIDNETHLAEVVVLGTAIMYWRLQDGRMGYYAKQNGQWKATPIRDDSGREAIALLFESMRLQQRGKLLDLPLPAPQEQAS